MFKPRFTQKRGNVYTLATLLAIAIFAMVFIYKSTGRNGSGHPFASTFIPGTGDTLNIAIEMNPSIYMPYGDTIKGKDYEILQAISRKHGVPMKFYPFVPLRHALDGLDNGTFDLVVASMPMTTEIKQDYLMTDPVYLDREILVQLADSLSQPITSQVQLAKDTVWITEDSPFRIRLENLADEIGDTIYIKSSPEYSAEALLILTARGIIKYAVINEGIARELQPKFPQIDISTPISFTQFQSWALNKSDSLLCDSINTWLRDVLTECQ